MYENNKHQFYNNRQAFAINRRREEKAEQESERIQKIRRAEYLKSMGKEAEAEKMKAIKKKPRPKITKSQ
ncbi:MAG: hypothetical protein IT410_00815 [Candidatus Doudnabacteria bacterium]|nr:hypothetical protein [Candidatus Doudnabacteria bacterium]